MDYLLTFLIMSFKTHFLIDEVTCMCICLYLILVLLDVRNPRLIQSYKIMCLSSSMLSSKSFTVLH